MKLCALLITMAADGSTEKKVKSSIADLPQYKDEHDSITKINEVTILSYDGKKWFITFKSDDFNWVADMSDFSQKGRDQLATLFNIKPRRTKAKINGEIKHYDQFNLYNMEGKIICVCVGFDMGCNYNTDGELFICDVPNPAALPQISLDEKRFRINVQHFPNH